MGVSLLASFANAEELEHQEAEPGAEAATKAQQPTPARSQQRSVQQTEQHERRQQWWSHAREVLFADLELRAEQTREVDAIVETQLRGRARSIQLDAEFGAARRRGDSERSASIDAELRELYRQLKEHHELFDEFRALLTEDQRPIFDSNRARFVAEAQAARKLRRPGRGKRPRT